MIFIKYLFLFTSQKSCKLGSGPGTMPPLGKGEPWQWAGAPEMTLLGHPWHVPGSSGALALAPCPSPTLCFAPPCSLNYFSPKWWLDSLPCLPKGGNSYVPHLPLEGRAPPSWWAGELHIHVDVSPHFGAWSCWREKEGSGDGSACHLM